MQMQYGISQLMSRAHLPIVFHCRDVIQICGQLWSQEQSYMKFWASFPKIYRFQQAKQIRKLTLRIGLLGKSKKNLHTKFMLSCFCAFVAKVAKI